MSWLHNEELFERALKSYFIAVGVYGAIGLAVFIGLGIWLWRQGAFN